jgi:hypothetical protein
MPISCKSTMSLGRTGPNSRTPSMASAGRPAVTHEQPDQNRLCNRLLKVNVLVGPGSLIPQRSSRERQRRAVDQLGPNALGEVLEPGRVADCYLGLLLPPGPAGEPGAGTILIVAPAALLHPRVPQPAGSVMYELLTGHPEREPGELVFVADLTCELRAWPNDTWAKLGVDPDQVAQAVVGCWQDGEVPGLQVTTSASRRPARSSGRR